MFPLIAIGGAIGAILSTIKGASWVSNQIDAAKGADATATSDKQSQTAGAASFEKALAAQAAGQSVPTAAGNAPAAAAPAPAVAAPAPASAAAPAPTPTPAPAGILAAAQGTDYASLARMQAGIAAYGSVGEHRGHHSGHPRPPAPGDDTMAPVAGNASLYGTPASVNAQSQRGPGSLANL